MYIDINKINPDINIGNDGSAYWNARAVINHIHDMNDHGVTNVYFVCDNDTVDVAVINHLLRMGEALRATWTTTQKLYVRRVMEHLYGDSAMLQKELAVMLGISTQQISNSMKSTPYYQYQENGKIVKTYMSKIEV